MCSMLILTNAETCPRYAFSIDHVTKTTTNLQLLQADRFVGDTTACRGTPTSPSLSSNVFLFCFADRHNHIRAAKKSTASTATTTAYGTLYCVRWPKMVPSGALMIPRIRTAGPRYRWILPSLVDLYVRL